MSDSSSSRSESTRWTPHYNDSFKGIPHKRSCTDCYCLVILLIFISCWCAIGYYVYWNGDISQLAIPRDSKGRHCGLDDEVRDKKFLFFFDITKCASMSIFLFGCPTKQICVSNCPSTEWFSKEIFNSPDPPPSSWKTIQSKLICNDTHIANTVDSKDQLKKVLDEERCASYYVKSTSAFFHMCLPNFGITSRSLATGVQLSTEQAQNYFSEIYKISSEIQQDLKKCWHFMILFVSVSLVSCLFVILIMGIITKIVVWVTLIMILIFLLYASVATFVIYEQTSAIANDDFRNDFSKENIFAQFQWIFRQKQTWMVLFGISSVSFILFLLLVIFLRSRIGLAVMLIGEGSKAINRIKSTLCFPFLSRILQFLVIVWFLAIFMYINSLGEAVYTVQGLQNDSDCRCKVYKEDAWCLRHKFAVDCVSASKGGECQTAKCVFSEDRHPKLKLYLHLYNLFGLLWGMYFVSGFSRMILSFCFATWYWTYNKYDLPFFTLIYSVFITTRYHLGTVALGSFLIATLGFLRTILEYMQRMLKQSDGLMTQCVTWSMRSCFWCLQRFLIFISNNAYIMCSIIGSGFFASAEEALGLLARNILRVVVLDKVLDFLMLAGKVSVTVFVGLLSYFAFSRPTLDLHYPLVPTVIVAIVVWIITASFFGVYVVAVDTLFLSFVKDSEMNDGTQNKPYYMTHKLKYMLREEAKARKSGSKKA